jgi:uncharacterized Zn-finger protein
MSTESTVELLAKDLNAQGGVYCPSPKAHMKIWNSHPKVYLDVAQHRRRQVSVLRHRVPS